MRGTRSGRRRTGVRDASWDAIPRRQPDRNHPHWCFRGVHACHVRWVVRPRSRREGCAVLASRRGSRTGPGRTTVLSAAQVLWPAPASITLGRSGDCAAAGAAARASPSSPPCAAAVPGAAGPAGRGGTAADAGRLPGTADAGLALLQRWSVLHRLPGSRLRVGTGRARPASRTCSGRSSARWAPWWSGSAARDSTGPSWSGSSAWTARRSPSRR